MNGRKQLSYATNRHVRNRGEQMATPTIVSLGHIQGTLLEIDQPPPEVDTLCRFVFEVRGPGVKDLLSACTRSVDSSNVEMAAVYLDTGDIETVGAGRVPDSVHRQVVISRAGVPAKGFETIDLRKIGRIE